jgi:hypothetical protein
MSLINNSYQTNPQATIQAEQALLASGEFQTALTDFLQLDFEATFETTAEGNRVTLRAIHLPETMAERASLLSSAFKRVFTAHDHLNKSNFDQAIMNLITNATVMPFATLPNDVLEKIISQHKFNTLTNLFWKVKDNEQFRSMPIEKITYHFLQSEIARSQQVFPEVDQEQCFQYFLYTIACYHPSLLGNKDATQQFLYRIFHQEMNDMVKLLQAPGKESIEPEAIADLLNKVTTRLTALPNLFTPTDVRQLSKALLDELTPKQPHLQQEGFLDLIQTTEITRFVRQPLENLSIEAMRQEVLRLQHIFSSNKDEKTLLQELLNATLYTHFGISPGKTPTSYAQNFLNRLGIEEITRFAKLPLAKCTAAAYAEEITLLQKVFPEIPEKDLKKQLLLTIASEKLPLLSIDSRTLEDCLHHEYSRELDRLACHPLQMLSYQALKEAVFLLQLLFPEKENHVILSDLLTSIIDFQLKHGDNKTKDFAEFFIAIIREPEFLPKNLSIPDGFESELSGEIFSDPLRDECKTDEGGHVFDREWMSQYVNKSKSPVRCPISRREYQSDHVSRDFALQLRIYWWLQEQISLHAAEHPIYPTLLTLMQKCETTSSEYNRLAIGKLLTLPLEKLTLETVRNELQLLSTRLGALNLNNPKPILKEFCSLLVLGIQTKKLEELEKTIKDLKQSERLYDRLVAQKTVYEEEKNACLSRLENLYTNSVKNEINQLKAYRALNGYITHGAASSNPGKVTVTVNGNPREVDGELVKTGIVEVYGKQRLFEIAKTKLQDEFKNDERTAGFINFQDQFLFLNDPQQFNKDLKAKFISARDAFDARNIAQAHMNAFDLPLDQLRSRLEELFNKIVEEQPHIERQHESMEQASFLETFSLPFSKAAMTLRVCL